MITSAVSLVALVIMLCCAGSFMVGREYEREKMKRDNDKRNALRYQL